ncbi:MAG: hypothetical protein LBF83_01520 [Spirochaetaceae bacterium]|jgi:hypothetical protein|nr:hypothetical protein [Spirochaetaceae bacterium]
MPKTISSSLFSPINHKDFPSTMVLLIYRYTAGYATTVRPPAAIPISKKIWYKRGKNGYGREYEGSDNSKAAGGASGSGKESAGQEKRQ